MSCHLARWKPRWYAVVKVVAANENTPTFLLDAKEPCKSGPLPKFSDREDGAGESNKNCEESEDDTDDDG